MTKKKFAIYVRVSRTDQILENQIRPLKEYAERMDWDYEIFQEKESTRKSRPIQWDLYNRLLKKEFDGLLFYKLDRWARSLKELVTHMEALHEKGVILVSFMENIDLGTSSGKLMMQIMGSFAEFERSIIRERTLAGLARARAQGKTLGRPRLKRKYTKGVGKQGGINGEESK
jgi:DNA invertase Pin-like site-specific DNA recombinase